jgi:hypothetical protein
MSPAGPRSICPKIVTVEVAATSAKDVMTQELPSTKQPISADTAPESS